MQTNSSFEQKYKNLILKILNKQDLQETRTGVKTYVSFCEKIDFDAGTQLIPLITGKKVYYDKAYWESIWILSGRNDLKFLKEKEIYWWNKFSKNDIDLGKTYGHQLRNFNSEFDQLKYVFNEIAGGSRRAVITFWNPSELNDVALPCCYTSANFVLTKNKTVLNMVLNFRSSDVFLGLPYDFIFGWMLLKLVANTTGKKLGIISYVLNDAHVYENHLSQAHAYLKNETYDLPKNVDNPELIEYKSGPFIAAPMN